ncbi:MAG: TraR/DksA family transcriptional regulator [Streptosporangiales bacterium]
MATKTDQPGSTGYDMDDEATATLPRRERLAALLPSLREQLEAQVAFRSEQLRELYAINGSEGSAARRQVDAELERAAQWTLDETRDALHRIDQGSYGTCTRCGEPITVERLEVIPHARFCPGCQQEYSA